MSRVKLAAGNRLHFWCPGCDEAHTIFYGLNGWEWNRLDNTPTFKPSVKVTGVQWEPEYGFHRRTHAVMPGNEIVCHSYVTDGRIQFLDDSTHYLAGKTVDLPEWNPPKDSPYA